jgi:hypothetical protein
LGGVRTWSTEPETAEAADATSKRRVDRIVGKRRWN